MSAVCNLTIIDKKIIKKIKSNTITFQKILYLAGNHIRPVVTLDKSWFTIHYVLRGTDSVNSTVLSSAILGGAEYCVDEDDYGPARLIQVEKVFKISNELNLIDSAQYKKIFKSRSFDWAKGFSSNIFDLDCELKYSIKYFDKLKIIYSEAAVKEMGIFNIHLISHHLFVKFLSKNIF